VYKAVVGDIDDFGNSDSGASANDDQSARYNDRRVGRLVQVRPGQTGFVFGVQIDEQIDLHGSSCR
jgi:hypothetical protein